VKHAYVSLLLACNAAPAPEVVAQLDALMTDVARLHEIVIVVPYGADPGQYQGVALTGPVTVVSTHIRATPDTALLAGLSRAVGDFVLEWRGKPTEVTGEIVEQGLDLTDDGFELVDVVGVEKSMTSRAFYRMVNSLRPRSLPVRKTVGRIYSRRAVSQVLAGAVFEPQLDVLTAELPVPRTQIDVQVPNPHRETLALRLVEGAALLSKGTRFGSAVPLGLAAISAAFGVGAAVYALVFFVLRGQTPEGWTTLMVVLGLGLAAILAMLGLIWTRIDALSRGLAQRRDATGVVFVTPPSQDP
jgi:F0F1-type ATP synthase membrane subunit c/vacuolar-type H+-ATPase subunit K